MPVERRSRRLFAVALAVPVILLVYVFAFAARFWAGVRPALATILGATVIGSVYVEEAWRRAPTARVSPARAAAVMALALVVAGASLPSAPVRAGSPREAVLDIARSYVGTPYRLGATGPQRVDCSGFIFRIFADAGELPRIGGRRLRAAGYYNWFKARGLVQTNPRKGEPGDLVYYRNSSHIGIYVGDGRVISALTTGVKEHTIKLNAKFMGFLKVSWINGGKKPKPDPAPPTDEGNKKKDKRRNNGNNGNNRGESEPTSQSAGDTVALVDNSNAVRGLATGTMNLRQAADPDGRIVGWVGRGSTFTVVDTGSSPSGALWYKVKLRNGKTGWVWSRWARLES